MTGTRFLLRSVAVASVAVLATGACGGDDDSGGTKADRASGSASSGVVSPAPLVDIVNFVFEPKSLTVKAGTAVSWTNQDAAVHSIKDTSAMATPVSPDLGKGGTFSITYGKPGSYSYICGIHQYMTGSVQVIA